MKLPKCTLGKTHKWEWVKNIMFSTQTPRTAIFRSKGMYKCQCGTIKYGEPR